MSCLELYDYIIIGAGPAGIQWGALLDHDNKHTYTILETESHAGAFFSIYPRARRLISHNRCNLGNVSDEFALRHDWHSLLEANETFCERHKRFYPWADEFVNYLEMVASSLHVQYDQRVTNITYTPEHALVCTPTQCIKSRHVVIATGLSVRPSPFPLNYANFPGLDKNEEADFCRGKRVGILGSGNAAFETANMLKTCARSVHILAHQTTFAALTHYPGHLRLQQGEFLDRYFLKSLDSVVVTNEMNRITHCPSPSSCYTEYADVIIYCGGFTGLRHNIVTRMSVGSKRRFPESHEFYSVPNSEGRGWYAGVLMHDHDYKKSSGGFVHGFRYLIRAQYRYLRALDSGTWDGLVRLDSVDAMQSKVVERIQESSGLYQMQGFLADVVCKVSDSEFVLLPEVPEPWVEYAIDAVKTAFGYDSANTMLRSVCLVKLEYGHISGGWNFEAAISNRYAQMNPPQFLHPTFTSDSKNVLHAPEDLDGTWKNQQHVVRIRSLIRECLADMSPKETNGVSQNTER